MINEPVNVSDDMSNGDDDTAPAGPGRVVVSGPQAAGPVDMTASYLGLDLRSPLVASASPLTGDLPSLRVLDASGIGAVVLPSLFEEQIEREADQLTSYLSTSEGAHAEAPGGYVPSLLDGYNTGAVRYLKLVRDARREVSVPVIASLNGVSRGGWIRYASMIADAGASALELNVYRVAADVDVTGREIESATLELVEGVVKATSVPVAVKLPPYFSAFANLAKRLVDAGAAGLVLFNRFYQPDIDLATLSVEPRLVLSTSDELRLPLRWCAILHGRIDGSLAATSGVHTADDLAKVLLAGASVGMTTSALLQNGPEHAATILHDLEAWLGHHGYGAVREAIGAVSQRNVADPAMFERANYLETIRRYASTFLH